METALALRRAGADVVITYFARELAETLGGASLASAVPAHQ
jgi:delta-aminolevulinic acid dehydratase/porphobilinogen synthase